MAERRWRTTDADERIAMPARGLACARIAQCVTQEGATQGGVETSAERSLDRHNGDEMGEQPGTGGSGVTGRNGIRSACAEGWFIRGSILRVDGCAHLPVAQSG